MMKPIPTGSKKTGNNADARVASTLCYEHRRPPNRDLGDWNKDVGLLRIPIEIFDEILGHYHSLPEPTSYYCKPWETSMPEEYRERTDAFRALSQTCIGLRILIMPRLWETWDCYRRPDGLDDKAYGTWLVDSLQKKAANVVRWEYRHYIRSFRIALDTRERPFVVAGSFAKILKSLPNLHTLHILRSARPIAKELSTELSGLELKTIRSVFIPDECYALLRFCPNVKRVRCLWGRGVRIICRPLKTAGCEILEGSLDWSDEKIVDRLLRLAPHLKELEIRPLIYYIGQLEIPAKWSKVVAEKLPNLPKLVKLTIVFPRVVEEEQDVVLIDAAKSVLTNSKAVGKKCLVVKYVQLATHAGPDSVACEVVHRQIIEDIGESD